MSNQGCESDPRGGKRKQSGSANAADPSVVTSRARTARQRLLAMARTSWTDLLPEDLVGIVATFLDDTKSVLDYTITAGPNLSRSIKKAYLKRNFSLIGKHRAKPNMYRAFLEANEDWRDMYDNLELLSSADRECFDSVFNDIVGAISLGHVEVVRHLIEVRGVDVNERRVRLDSDPSHLRHEPLLFFAIRALKLPVLEYLLGNAMLSINATPVCGGMADGMEGFTCLHCVGREFRIKFQAEHAALAEAAALLLSHPAIDVNAATWSGTTPLIMAVDPTPENRFLRLLLSREDINVNAATIAHQNTALHFATDKASVKYLIFAGADPHIRNSSNKTPLDLATKELADMMKEWINEANAPAP